MELQLGEQLGSGISGTVYLATDADGNLYAVKDQLDIRLPEYHAGYLNHPNLLSYVNVSPGVEIVSTPVGISLDKVVEDPMITMTERINIMIDIIRGIYHMHLNGYLHLDLGLKNIIMTYDKRGVIIDFGHTIYGRNKLYDSTIESSRDYSFDLFTLGLIIFEMLTRTRLKVYSRKPYDYIVKTYKLARVENIDLWATLTYQLTNRSITTEELAAKVGVTVKRIDVPLVPKQNFDYRDVLNRLTDEDFSMPYYFVVHMVTIHAVSSLSVDDCVAIILNIYDEGEREVDVDKILSITPVRPLIIDTLADAMTVHKLLLDNNIDYYTLPINTSFDRPPIALGDVLKNQNTI